LAIKTCQRESETTLYRKTFKRELIVARLAEREIHMNEMLLAFRRMRQ